MKLNLQKKNSFWSLYKKWIIGICSTVGTLGVIGGTIYVLTNYWREICEWFSNLDWHYVIIMTHYISGFSTVAIVLFLIYTYGKFLIRQQFIPLSKVELKDNGIETIADYSEFLQKYLMGFAPLKKIHKLCFLSSFHYLMTAGERSLLFSENYFKCRIPTFKQREEALANILATPMSNDITTKTETILDNYFENEIGRYSFRENATLTPFAHIKNMTFLKRHKLSKFIIPILIISVLLLVLSSISLIFGLAVVINIFSPILILLLIAFCLVVLVTIFPVI